MRLRARQLWTLAVLALAILVILATLGDGRRATPPLDDSLADNLQPSSTRTHRGSGSYHPAYSRRNSAGSLGGRSQVRVGGAILGPEFDLPREFTLSTDDANGALGNHHDASLGDDPNETDPLRLAGGVDNSLLDPNFLGLLKSGSSALPSLNSAPSGLYQPADAGPPIGLLSGLPGGGGGGGLAGGGFGGGSPSPGDQPNDVVTPNDGPPGSPGNDSTTGPGGSDGAGGSDQGSVSVPEPSTLILLLATGMAAALLHFRRRQSGTRQ